MRKLVIDTSAVRHNLAVIRSHTHNAAIYAMLAGDARGTGIVPMAALLREEGIRRFAVSEVAEAEALRKAGFLEEEILMLGSTTDPDILERLVDLNVVCTISSVDTGLALNALAERRATVVPAHIQVDTGMGFGGFLASEPDKILLAYRSLPKIALEGIYTQLHASSPKDGETLTQLARFQAVLDTIHAAGFETGMVHAADSFTTLHFEDAILDGVRVGSALLGRCRRTRDDGLEVVGHGQAQLTQVRWLPKGHTVGSGKPLTLKKPTRVALIPVGYQNGFAVDCLPGGGWLSLLRWRRSLRKRCVRIGSQKARVIGPVGAAQILVDVTKIRCSAGDWANFDIDPIFSKGFSIEYI